MYSCVCIYVYIHISLYIYIYMYYVYVNMCIYIYICITYHPGFGAGDETGKSYVTSIAYKRHTHTHI